MKTTKYNEIDKTGKKTQNIHENDEICRNQQNMWKTLPK